MRPNGTDATNLTEDATKLAKFPDWSPDGSRIAFDQEGTVVIVNADGSGRFDLTLGESRLAAKRPELGPVRRPFVDQAPAVHSGWPHSQAWSPLAA